MIAYNTSIEVTFCKYALIRKAFPGSVAHRQDNGRYFIKVWSMTHAEQIEKYLNS